MEIASFLMDVLKVFGVNKCYERSGLEWEVRGEVGGGEDLGRCFSLT